MTIKTEHTTTCKSTDDKSSDRQEAEQNNNDLYFWKYIKLFGE